MSKVKKIVVALLALAGILLIALVVLVKVLVTPERVKSVVLPMAEKALQRPVTLGEVKVGLTSGIELHDLAIAERSGSEALLKTKLVRLRFKLLPLLFRQVVVDEITVEDPQLRLLRYADGSLSIADLLGPPSTEVAGKVPKTEAGGDSAFSLLVSKLALTNGRLLFLDQQPGATVPSRIELSGLEIHMNDLALQGNTPVQLRAMVNGTPLSFDGHVRLKEKAGNLAIEVQGLDLAVLAPYYRQAFPGELTGAKLDIKGNFDGNARQFTVRGLLGLRELSMRLEALPQAAFDRVAIGADVDAEVDLDKGTVALNKGDLDYNGIRAGVTGRLLALLDDPQGELKVTLPTLDLRSALAALPAGLTAKAAPYEVSGNVRGTAQLNGRFAEPRQLLKSGELVLEQVQGNVAGVRPALEGRILLTGERVRLEQTAIRLGDLRSEIVGTIEQPFTAPAVDLAVTVPRTDLGKALANVPAEQLKGVAAMAPAGAVELQVRLKGALDKPQTLLQGGQALLHDVQVSVAGQRPSFNGKLRMNGDQVTTEGLTVQLGKDTAQLKVSARNLFGKPLQVGADVTAQRFLVEPFLSGSKESASKPVPAQGGEGKAPADELGPFDLPVQAAGTVRIGETVWKGLTVNNFLAEYELRDNQLSIRRMSGNFAGGSFSNKARVDLRQPGLIYDADINLQGVKMESLLTALTPAAANTLYGRVDLKGQVAGRGTRWADISRSLSGDMALSLADGKLVSPALVKGFADFLQIADFDEIVFRDFRGKARLTNGKAEIDSSLVSSRIKLAPQGTIGLDGSLNLAMDTRLAPELADRFDQRGKVTRYLTDAEGWTQIPLLITGTVQAPRYGLDPKGVQAQAGKIIEKELQRGLDKLLNRPKPQEQPSEGGAAPGSGETGSGDSPAPPPASPAQQLLDQSLQRLFKKQ